MSAADLLLDVRGLSVDIGQGAAALRVVNDLSLTVRRGEAVGLVGESGSGKSMTAFALMNLFPSPLARLAAGQVLLEGRDLARLPAAELRAVRGACVGMVFQDPTSYLDPLMPVGRQIAEPLRAHGRTDGLEARVLELLDMMELPHAARVARQYPHELSGGMRQRILIASALAMRPALLIADEPTTALDVTVQAEILKLLMRLRKELDLGILLITHDLAVVAETCQRVNVMYAGQVVEANEVAPLFAAPRHPYTQGLLASILSPRSRAHSLFSIPGSVPIAGHWPAGCRFHPRCPIARAGLCDSGTPALRTRGPGADRCLRSDEALAADAWQRNEAAPS
ncbi:ABC transporter ATP-binding protein [Variovorax sp. J31P207]|uniref:ABC transporter ATP-binding protein n=1 Tax=Variovorax sp. J31P207 TaxID=3053510 RepID=UPI002574B790|nr:ABC transporter ATP-binding protein [Variovorax sp. J31P207]MDM0071402.1 ABC transporter ATP-binding protein [Variovorax sp. J31P207]